MRIYDLLCFLRFLLEVNLITMISRRESGQWPTNYSDEDVDTPTTHVNTNEWFLKLFIHCLHLTHFAFKHLRGIFCFFFLTLLALIFLFESGKYLVHHYSHKLLHYISFTVHRVIYDLHYEIYLVFLLYIYLVEFNILCTFQY